MCLSRNYQDIPERDLVEDCALEHGIDFDKLNHCVSRDDGAYAIGMLRESVERSAEANVTKSCTVSSPLSPQKKGKMKDSNPFPGPSKQRNPLHSGRGQVEGL